MTRQQFCIVILIAACFTIILYGCSQGKPEEPGVIEVLSGKTQLETYKKVKSTIEKIDKSRSEQYQGLE